MGARLASILPRLAVATLVFLVATASLTFAAQRQIVARTAAPFVPAAPKAAPLVVPDVRHQAYVFAKGILQDGGFAWRVSGSVQGYAGNLVSSQSPSAGTKVADTGAPTIVLSLVRNPSYRQQGAPENASPYAGTATRSPATRPVAPKPAAPKPAATKRTAPAKPVTPKHPKQRPPAFVVPGARKEPLDEMPLPDRALQLSQWLGSHRRPTDANVQYWLYQHAWIVTGARFGWWHGAEALRLLIVADRHAQAVWGIGGRSKAVARNALVEVEARSK